MTPQRDLNDKALQPERDYGAKRDALAASLPYLRDVLGVYGDVAVLSAKFDAIFEWLRRDNPTGLNADVKVVREALTLWRENALHRAGLSRSNGLHLPILQRISMESQEEAERVAGHTMDIWEAAGRPRLTSGSIRWAHQMFLHRVRLKEHAERMAGLELAA